MPCICICLAATGNALSPLTVEEKVGQLLMVHFNGEEANSDAQRLIQNAHVGAIIYYNWSNGLHSPLQVQRLSNGLQKMAAASSTGIPLLITTDQEGGVVVRLNQGFTSFPGNCSLARTHHPELAEPCAVAIAEELRAVGINMNLAPDVDINNNPLNPIIGVRAFSSSPEEVALLGASTLQGYRSVNVITTLKHFPGHGDVTADSHAELPVLAKSLEELDRNELLPFKKLARLADVIMTGHLIVSAIDPVHCATLSQPILEGLLRDKIGFQGVIISDSLIMEGVLKNAGSIDNAAVMAIQAGCDMLIFGGRQLIGSRNGFELTTEDIFRIHQHLVNAVRTGAISKERLDASVERILALKEKYKLFDTPPATETAIVQHVKTAKHRELAKQIADLSTSIVKGGSLLPMGISAKSVCIILPAVVQDTILETTLQSIGKERRFVVYPNLDPDASFTQQAVTTAKDADLVLMFSYNGWKNQGQQRLAQALASQGRPLLVVALCDPQDNSFFTQADVFIDTFSPSSTSIQAALDKLFGKTFSIAKICLIL